MHVNGCDQGAIERWLLRAGLLAIAAAIAACASNAGGAQDGSPAARRQGGAGASGEAVPVATATVVEKAVPLTISAVGSVEAISSVQIHGQVTGQLSEITFSEGQDVRAGQPLFTLDERPFVVALDQARAVLEKDKAQAANAAVEANRYGELFQKGLIPRDQYDAQMTTSASATATEEADRAAVQSATLNLQYTRITAPVAGRTGSLQVHRGDLVRANDTAPMVVINQMAPIYVTFSVPGGLLEDIRRYQSRGPLQVEARVPNASDAPETGSVTFIDNAVDSATGTIKLKGTFANASRRLWPGLFVDVALELTTEPHAVVVPTVAVQSGQQGQYVFVVRTDQTVDMRPVKVARSEGQESVIASGLSQGETVVTDGQLQLTPGAHIRPRPPVVSTRTE